jgi:hypothetical protein
MRIETSSLRSPVSIKARPCAGEAFEKAPRAMRFGSISQARRHQTPSTSR